MARMYRWIGLVALSFSLTGCVAAEKYNALKLDRDRLAEQLSTAQNEASAARAQADSFKAQLDALLKNGGDQQALVNNLTQQLAALQNQYDELNKKYMDALGKAPGQPVLPEDVDRELKDLAAQNPDILEYDPYRGLLKFKSDVTFALGSAELTAKAKSVIDRVASILNSASVSHYELLVAGHTDSTRVVNPRTIAAGHKDNWFLSAHRAITVGSELMKEQVSPQRVGVLGYADQRPVASNATDAGRAQNRRVEVLVLPKVVRSHAAVGEVAHKASKAPKAAAVKMNKDVVPAEEAPADAEGK